jgi:hypothetical protein
MKSCGSIYGNFQQNTPSARNIIAEFKHGENQQHRPNAQEHGLATPWPQTRDVELRLDVRPSSCIGTAIFVMSLL